MRVMHMRGSVWRLAIDEVWPEKSTGLEKRRRFKASGRSSDILVLGECKALWGELERVSASSLLHYDVDR